LKEGTEDNIMFKIKKLNNISNIIYEKLPKDLYEISEDMDNSEADAFILRSADCHDMEFSSRNLAFARAGIGVNNIPVDRCTKEGIVVFNTPGANANAVKELVLCGLLLGSRDIVGGIKFASSLADEGKNIMPLVEKGKSRFVGPEIQGKTLGVIGLGAIGVLVANMAADLGMTVIGYDPFISIENAWHLSTNVNHALSLDEIMTRADYITIHVPLMDSTRNYINRDHIYSMKDNVVILNFARNGLIDESALIPALREGKVRRYITDFPDEVLLKEDNVVCLPHLGASTPESEENCAYMASGELKRFLEIGEIRRSVNFPECILSPSRHSRITVIHENVPGVIANITSLLSAQKLNVEEMINKSRNDIAYSVFDLDKRPDADVLEKIGELEWIIKVREIIQ
jgi:D-3-phosphoglycerate dehydrogenase